MDMAEMTDVLELVFVETDSKTGMFDTFLGTEKIGTFKAPLFQGARKLLEMGVPTSRMVTTRHMYRPYQSFAPMSVGAASRLMVTEGEATPKIAPYKPFKRGQEGVGLASGEAKGPKG